MDKQILTEKNSALLVQISPIKESIKSEIQKTGMMVVKNVPSTLLNKKNANGRIYSKESMQSALSENKKKKQYENKSLLCTADDHPEGTYPKPSQSSHVVLNARIMESNGQQVLLNDWLILNTEQGKNLRALIEAGCSLGTSIRGLGRQNESTGEIEEYEYLGTDVVGNPSAGTFAEFKELSESIEIEPVNETLIESIKNSEVLDELEQVSQIKGVYETKSNEASKMFNLEEAIKEYKQVHTESSVTQEAITDLLKIENKVMESGENFKLFEYFKKEVLGDIPHKDTVKKENTNKVEEAKDEDVLNKTERHFEAAQVLAEELKEQNESLEEDLISLRNYREASVELIEELTAKLKEANKKNKQLESNSELEEAEIVKQMEMAAVKMGTELQKEAKEAILQLENRLERSIQLGNMVSKYFKASKAVNEALIERINNNKSEEITESTHSFRKRVKSKSKDLTESTTTRHGWR